VIAAKTPWAKCPHPSPCALHTEDRGLSYIPAGRYCGHGEETKKTTEAIKWEGLRIAAKAVCWASLEGAGRSRRKDRG
jgi:hypothetical protein